MAVRRFDIPPLLPLIGSNAGNFLHVIRDGKVDPRCYGRVSLTALVMLIAAPFQLLDAWYFSEKIRRYNFSKPPLFIIGHWRSGTTLLHNCLCQDGTASYLTTYQSLFPNNLRSKFLFKTFCRIGMPEKRPSDNMKLNVEFPQEEEFALGNIHPNFYYRFFYFPMEYMKYYRESVLMDVPVKQRESWKKAYLRLLKKAALNTGGQRMIVKNPANTARIPMLLEMFPDARFLFIYRNPVKVYLSTRRFFQSLFPAVWLHRVDKDHISHMILDTYLRMMEDYNRMKKLIPPGNLMELRFEDFEHKPVAALQHIYSDLLEEDFEPVREKMVRYLTDIRSYRKNDYATTRRTVDAVANRWQTYMKRWNYNVPEDIDLTK